MYVLFLLCLLKIPSRFNVIASRYIINPLLIEGYKFDIRIYVFVTSILPLRIYIYKEGLVRFATEKYDVTHKNKFIHLTNYAVNKLSKNFIPNTDPMVDNQGSKWSLSALREYLTNHVCKIVKI
jgi:hypothetical protein